MTYTSGIPNHIMQNVADIKANVDSIISQNSNIGDNKASFNNILNESFGGFSSNTPEVKKINNEGYSKSNKPVDLNNSMNSVEKVNNQFSDNIENSYKYLMGSDFNNSIAPMLANLNKDDILKKLNINNNKFALSDKDIFDSETLTPNQITTIMKENNFPNADRTYSNNESIGQVIYDLANNAGTIETGNNKINTGLVISMLLNDFKETKAGGAVSQGSFVDKLAMKVNEIYDQTHHNKAEGISFFENLAKNKFGDLEKMDSKISANFTEIVNKPNHQKTEELLNSLVSSISSIPSLNNNSKNGIDINSLMGMFKTNQNSNPMGAVSSLTGNNGIDINSIMGMLKNNQSNTVQNSSQLGFSEGDYSNITSMMAKIDLFKNPDILSE